MAGAPTRFRGFPAEALSFFADLEANNTKQWWDEHRSVYDESVRGPMEAFVDEVPDGFRPLRIFRPYRDVRFSSDKRPYKTNIGAYGERQGGTGYYVHLSVEGLMAASGYYQMRPDQLQRFRQAVDDGDAGRAAEAVLAELDAAGFHLGGEALKTAPRGWPKDHPRIALLRHKALYAWRSWPPAKWLSTRKALDRAVEAWAEAEPLNRWLDDHVGPSTLPPEEGR